MPAKQERNEGGVEWTNTLVESGTAASYPWLLACAIAAFSVSIRKWPVAYPFRHSIEQLPSIHSWLMSDTQNATLTSHHLPAAAQRTNHAASQEASGLASDAILTVTVNREVHGIGIFF